jgi:hypothetical protein
MAEEENARLVRRYFLEAWTAGNLSLIDELVSPGYIGHGPFGDISGPEQEQGRLAYIHDTFPGFRHTIEDEIVAGDKIVLRFSGRWPLRGEWMGIQVRGQEASGTGIIIYRVENGRIAESWLEEDLLGTLQQLGARVVPGEALEAVQEDSPSAE